MLLVHGTSENESGQMIAYWVGEMLKKPIHAPYTALGWLNSRDSLVGGAVFNDYNGANIEVTIYGPGALTRGALRDGLRYVFDQLQCVRLTARCVRSNKRMRKLFPRLGFRYEAILSDFFGTGKANDAIVFYMKREQAAKWIGHASS